MAFRKKPERPRRPRSQAGKVPLTYYRSQSAEPDASPFEKKFKRPSQLRRGSLIILDFVIAALLILGLVYSLVLKPNPRIIVSSRTYHDSSVYEQAAADKLSSLQNRTKFTLNEKKVLDALQSKFPEIASSDIELPILRPNPTIRLGISPPSFLLSSGGQVYVVDEQGKAVASKDDLPRVGNLSLVIDQSGFKAASGKQIISGQGAAFLKALIEQCRKSGVPIKSLTLPAMPQELDLRTSDQNYYTKFFLGSDPAIQLGQFLAARHQFQSGQQPSEYLDVRTAGKIFYK